MSNSTEERSGEWWLTIRPRFTIIYLIIALALLLLSSIGHVRLLSEIGHTFGGFFWAIDTDGQVVIVSTPPQLPPFGASAGTLTSTDHIIAVNGQPAANALSTVYEHTQPGATITYTIQHDNSLLTIQRPTVTFTMDMWWENYGLGLLAGISWLLVGIVILATAKDWSGAVEGITLFPPAMLFLLYSHWGNIQQASPASVIFQLLWIPSFALLGAAFIHLSLTYRPEALSSQSKPRLVIDLLPYLPLPGLLLFEWISFVILRAVPTHLNLLLSLGYATFGGLLSFGVGITSLLRVIRFIPGKAIPENVRRRLFDLIILWISGVGLAFCLGILPILLTGHTLLPLQIFYVLAAVYPLILAYAIRSLRLIDRLQVSLEERESALEEQRKTTEELRLTNLELKQATSLLLHADAHLRSILSQRIHDQPKQQALRIRSLLGYWQHKLKIEAEQDPQGKVAAQPVTEALGKVRKISEELESDLRGLQLLVEDAYQRRSLGLKLHLEKLIREDLPALHSESPLKVQPDLWALDVLSNDLEQSEEGTKIAEAISYGVTQALLNVYNHAGASYATVRAINSNGILEVYIIDDGRGFDPATISPEKTSMFKAQLKAHEAGGSLTIQSTQRPQAQHGTTVILRLPIPANQRRLNSGPLTGKRPVA